MPNWRSNMNTKATIIILILLLLGFGQTVYGQDGRVYVSNNPSGQGISVRWAGPEISYQEGIRIFRKTGRGNWVLITASPIIPPTTVPQNQGLSDNEKGMVRTLIEQDHQAFVDGFSGILILMESLKSYRLALALHIAYDDLAAEVGKKYSYKVEAVHKGKTIVLGESEEIKCGPFSPLPAPQNISFERKKKRSFVWWENDEDHYYAYNLYVKGPSDTDFAIHTKELGSGIIKDKKDKFIELQTHKDSLYQFKLEALDYFGQKAEMSEVFELIIKDFDPPVPPSLLVKSNAKEARVDISWTPSPDADLAGYNLYRQIADVDTVYTKLNRKVLSPTDTTYVDMVGEPGVYNYELECLDEAGNSSRSVVEFADVKDIIPPPIPDFIGLKADTGMFIIQWQHVKADDLKGYIVMRSVADENNADNIYMPASKIITENRFEEPIAKNMQAPYVYIVRSVDSLLNYSANSKEVVGQLPDVTPPVKPFVKKVEEEGEALRIVWMENVERDLKGYHIYKRKEGDTLDFVRLNGMMVPKDIAAYTDREAIRGESYEYYVEAIDFADLKSPPSNIAKGRMKNLPLAGAIEISRQKFNPNKQEFSLAWSGSSLVNEPIVGYAVFRSENGGKALQRGKVAEKMQFKEKLSKPGTYEYHVRVYGKRGNILHSELIQIQVDKE